MLFRSDDLEKEWQVILSKVKKESLRQEIMLINEEIGRLDSSLERTEAEEKKLDQLLSLIIQKQAAVKRLD